MAEREKDNDDRDNEFVKRLSKFNIEFSSIEWFDLVIESGLRLDLRKSDPQLGRVVQKVKILSFEQLRNCLGVPASARLLSEKNLTFLPSHFLLDKNQKKFNEDDHRNAETAARLLLGEKMDLSSEAMDKLNRWTIERIHEIKPAFLRDVYIAQKAQLLLDVDVLFARYITIERGGKIYIQSNRHVAVDCRGIRSTLPVARPWLGTENYLYKV